MKLTVTATITLVAIAAFAPLTSTDAQIKFGGDAAGLYTWDLEAYAAQAGRPGTALVTLIDPALGITLGEKLIGQVNTPDGWFDVVGGTPSTPLTMDTTNAADVGLNLMTVFGTTIVNGLGELGFPQRDSVGEGSVTILYSQDQAVVGFDLVGANPGPFNILFYDRNGELLDDITLYDPPNDTYIYQSDHADIAAVTFNNKDFGGVGFDNFLLSPGGGAGTPACEITGPYQVVPTGGMLAIPMNVAISRDPVGGTWQQMWITDCPGAYFDNPALPDATLFLQPQDDCRIECNVALVLDSGIETDVCSADLVVDGAVGAGVTCPPDKTVESDGLGNVDELSEWLGAASSEDPSLTNDFTDFPFLCDKAGAVTVNWWIDTLGGGACGGLTECASTFTIVDSTPPTLEVDTSPILVDSDECDESPEIELPAATAYDGDGSELPVTNDAPDAFPIGQTTTVTFSASDDCGNTAMAAVDVTLPFSSGVKAIVTEKVVGRKKPKGDNTTPLPTVLVEAYDVSEGSCVYALSDEGDDSDSGDDSNANTGDSDSDSDDEDPDPRDFAAIVAACQPAASSVTNDEGVALIGLPPGQYLVIAAIPMDDPNDPILYLGQRVGRVKCGKWKKAKLRLLVDADGHPVHDD